MLRPCFRLRQKFHRVRLTLKVVSAFAILAAVTAPVKVQNVLHIPPQEVLPKTQANFRSIPVDSGADVASAEASEKHSTIKSSSSSVYYNGVYWNNFEQVRSYMNKLATGDSSIFWYDHLFKWHGEKPFVKALIVSCGNGFLERQLFSKGILLSAVGIDVDGDLLKTARTEAEVHNLPFRYYQLDSNKQHVFPESGYDIVVNHAALHHIAYIDFHVRALSRLLQMVPGGVLVNYDFVGPHRNQYDAETWKALNELNADSDECYRKPNLVYPHLPTMLATDPSEAVHSELLVTVLHRYFEPVWQRSINGALAYELLTHNENLQHNCSSGANLSQHIDWVLKNDAQYAESHRGRELFMYSIMKPRTEWASKNDLHMWTQLEDDREALALQNGGRYYPPTVASEKVYSD